MQRFAVMRRDTGTFDGLRELGSVKAEEPELALRAVLEKTERGPSPRGRYVVVPTEGAKEYEVEISVSAVAEVEPRNG